jgi:hypothetical protein
MKNNYKTINFPPVMTIKLGDKEKTELFLFYLGTTHGPQQETFLSALNISCVPTENLHAGKWKRKLGERKETKQKKN